jgi:hypothetical protein
LFKFQPEFLHISPLYNLKTFFRETNANKNLSKKVTMFCTKHQFKRQKESLHDLKTNKGIIWIATAKKIQVTEF